MPRQAPVRTARFDLLPTRQGHGYHMFDGVRVANATATASQNISASAVIDYRSAGMWFKDIATVFGFSTASQASAFYVRECRLRSISPLVRETHRRAVGEDTAGMDDLPEYLSTSWFQGEREFTFGCEIETVGISLARAQQAVSGLQLQVSNHTHYRHDGTHQWKCVPDGSLRGRGGTAEVVSRVLTGHEGFVELRRVMKSLKAIGAKTNRSTGMHTHLGVSHLGDRQLALIIRMHCQFQNILDGVISENRKRNMFCRHRLLNDALQLASRWATGDRPTGQGRYWSLNLQSFDKYETFEMRSYDGCLNPKRATAWIQLHQDFFQFCCEIANNSMGEVQGRLRATDTIQVLDPLTESVLFRNDPMIVSDWASVKNLFKEWIEGENTFIKSPRVREILKAEWNRLHSDDQI